MRQGLSRDEAMALSYEEMWVRTRQGQFEERRDALAQYIMRLQGMTPMSEEGAKSIQRAITQTQSRINSLEYCFYAEVELG